MVRRNVLLVDVAVAMIAALVILAVTPGLAVAATIAIVVLAACTISFKRESQRERRARGRRPRRPA